MVLAWINNHVRMLLGIALALIFLFGGVLDWGMLHPPVTVTFENREQAATPSGVEKAANAAQLSISSEQTAAIASVIKEDEARVPDALVQTTGERIEETIKTELRKSGGQFAIVTDSKKSVSVPAHLPVTGKAVTALDNVGAVLPNTPLTLNQYNIKAYPDRLIQFGGSYQEVLAAYSWKVNVPKIPLIAPHGDVGYLGFYGHANFDHPDISRIGIMLTIPK